MKDNITKTKSMKNFKFITSIKDSTKFSLDQWVNILKSDLPTLFSETDIATYLNWEEFYNLKTNQNKYSIYVDTRYVEDTRYIVCFSFVVKTDNKKYILTLSVHENYAENCINVYNEGTTISIKSNNIYETIDIILYNIYLMVEHLTK